MLVFIIINDNYHCYSVKRSRMAEILMVVYNKETSGFKNDISKVYLLIIPSNLFYY